MLPLDPVSNATVTASTLAELTGVWLIRTSLAVTNGVTLDLKGSAAGGDCDEVRALNRTEPNQTKRTTKSSRARTALRDDDVCVFLSTFGVVWCSVV